MAARLGVFLIVWLWLLPLGEVPRPLMVVWNVGQGQWVTVRDERGCWHFDAGGESAPWRQVMRLCRHLPNYLSLSHWDWDHIGFVAQMAYHLPNTCLLHEPPGSATARKARIVERIGRCSIPPTYPFWENPAVTDSSNALSRVLHWRGILIPGDSTRHEEAVWRQTLDLRSVRILILGHHGSQTSTSRELLHTLSSLRMAIASSRYERYGHPHRRVREELQHAHVPLITTEDWGHIIIWL
ncbi:MAG: hydrolase [Bdellovibrionales bacterium]